MFNDRYGLTEAVLSGRKTQTRRLCKEQYWSFSDLINANKNDIFLFERPKYDIGEVVAVAQAYREIAHPDGFLDERYEVKDEFVSGWANKLFVRAALMPHQIRITDVRVERLQDISDEDCIAEGIYKDDGKTHFNGYAFQITRDQYGNMLSKQWYSTPREAYAALITRISGKGVWESNPYVFVYEFDVVNHANI